MYKKFFSAASLFLMGASSAFAAENETIGVVNFSTCITDSKYGKKEQENLETLRKQLTMLMENTEKELKDISSKFEDTEYLDSLSPKAEEELKAKFQALQEDLNRYQNQFYQVLNHANYQMVQKMSIAIANAAEKVAGKNGLKYVINKEACFYICPDLDVTSFVISEMDRNYDVDAKSRNLSEQDLPIQPIDETTMDRAG
jgi:outer membrane protein